MSETTIPAFQPLHPVTAPHAVYGTLRALPSGATIILEYDEGYVLTTVSEALSEWERAYAPADLFTIPSRSDLHGDGPGQTAEPEN